MNNVKIIVAARYKLSVNERALCVMVREVCSAGRVLCGEGEREYCVVVRVCVCVCV